MIVDSHAHAWPRWPYQPPVPDPSTRGQIDQLLWEMDENDVDRAVIVSARIDHNDDNNDYVARVVAAYPDRLAQFVDIGSYWIPDHTAPRAAEQVAAVADRWPVAGVSRYLPHSNTGWLASHDAVEFFTAAAEAGLPVALSARPAWQEDLRALAELVPNATIIVNHLGAARPWSAPESGADQVLASAKLPNIGVKVSGFYYGADRPWEFPWPAAIEAIADLHRAYGAHRMFWGSDYPVARRAATYRQTLEVVRSHCDFLTEEDRDLILGGAIAEVVRHNWN